jgi:geranylgeranyl diphosphate synthase type II
VTPLAGWRARIEQALRELAATDAPLAPRLTEAMRYSLLAGGKRVRPLLALAACQAAGGDIEAALHPACAVELVHTYSLVHDDLPAMDDDDLRRGRPTCHVAFDEATAILAGCGLLTHAFEILAGCDHLAPATRVEMIRTLASAAGPLGMLSGQALDLAAEGTALPLPRLEALHRAKTGALIRASVAIGALAAPDAGAGLRQQLDAFADGLGLAFQVVDDLLDVDGDATRLGKRTGADAAHGKNTYPQAVGVDGARALATTLTEAALTALVPLGGRADALRAIAGLLLGRDH